MTRRGLAIVGIGGFAALVYACGGSDNTLTDGGLDSAADTTVSDTGGKDTGSKDTGTSDTGQDAPSDTGTTDTGAGDGGVSEAGCDDGSVCQSFGTNCDDGGCPTGQVCVTTEKIASITRQCYPLPTCGCGGETTCACIGSCACAKYPCSEPTDAGILCTGPISRREYKTDIRYLSEEDREALAARTLTTPSDQDLYGYTSSVLATVQEQQRQLDLLKKQVEALQTK